MVLWFCRGISWLCKCGLSSETFREKERGAYVGIDDCRLKSTEGIEEVSVLGGCVSTFIKGGGECMEETLKSHAQGEDWERVGSSKMAFSITSSTTADGLLQIGRG